MKFRHTTLLYLSAIVWLAIGIMLLTLGLRFVMQAVQFPALTYIDGRFSILRHFSDPHRGVVVLLTAALIIGFIKGRFVLGKTVKRQVARITALEEPVHIKYLYSKAFYILIGGMMLLGMTMRFLPITIDVRGAVDIAIGAALMNGATLLMRSATGLNLKKSRES